MRRLSITCIVAAAASVNSQVYHDAYVQGAAVEMETPVIPRSNVNHTPLPATVHGSSSSSVPTVSYVAPGVTVSRAPPTRSGATPGFSVTLSKALPSKPVSVPTQVSRSAAKVSLIHAKETKISKILDKGASKPNSVYSQSATDLMLRPTQVSRTPDISRISSVVSSAQASETKASKLQDASKPNAGSKADSQSKTDAENSTISTQNIGTYVAIAVAATLFMVAGFVSIRWAVHRKKSTKKDKNGQFLVRDYDHHRDSDASAYNAFRRGSNTSELDALRRGSTASSITDFGRSRSSSMGSIYGESHPQITMSRPVYFNGGGLGIPLSVIMSNFLAPMASQQLPMDNVQDRQHPLPYIKEDVPLPKLPPPPPTEYRSDMDTKVLEDAMEALEELEDEATLSGTSSMLSQHVSVYSNEEVLLSQYQERRRSSSTVGIYSPLAKAVLSKHAPQPTLFKTTPSGEGSMENYSESYEQLEQKADHMVYKTNGTIRLEETLDLARRLVVTPTDPTTLITIQEQPRRMSGDSS